MAGDTEEDADWMARKVASLRIFRDEQGKMNLALPAVGGSILAVSQFTLAADGAQGGNRPGFSAAAAPEQGNRLYEFFCAAMRRQGLAVETGIFGADMKVSLVNDGPVTIWLDRPHR
jgi:D-tyrosyl-tRNA(Tyr) deacylase